MIEDAHKQNKKKRIAKGIKITILWIVMYKRR
jgi:hypothetical protein